MPERTSCSLIDLPVGLLVGLGVAGTGFSRLKTCFIQAPPKSFPLPQDKSNTFNERNSKKHSKGVKRFNVL